MGAQRVVSRRVRLVEEDLVRGVVVLVVGEVSQGGRVEWKCSWEGVFVGVEVGAEKRQCRRPESAGRRR